MGVSTWVGTLFCSLIQFGAYRTKIKPPSGGCDLSGIAIKGRVLDRTHGHIRKAIVQVSIGSFKGIT